MPYLRKVSSAPSSTANPSGGRSKPPAIGTLATASPVVSVEELQHHVPKAAVGEYKKASKARRKGESAETIEHLTTAVAFDPQVFEALNDLGVEYINANQVQLAIERLTAAIGIAPHRPVAYTNLAVAFLAQNRLRDAERLAREAVKVDCGWTLARLLLGASLVMQHKFTTEAKQSLEKAVAEFPVARLMLAPVLAANGDFGPGSARAHVEAYIASSHGAGTATAIADQWMQRLDRAARK